MNALRANSKNAMRSLTHSGHGRAILSSPGHNVLGVRTYFKDRDKEFINRCPMNFGILFVPENEAFVVERFGKFKSVLPSGLNFLVPFIDRVAYVHSLKEEVISVPDQSAFTKDNVTLKIDAVLYVKIEDPWKASYKAEKPILSAIQRAQSTMRAAIGNMTLDRAFEERQHLNDEILAAINSGASDWGLTFCRYEIKDIILPHAMRETMMLQAEAERKKRAVILTSEGERQKTINWADADKSKQILAAEARKRDLTLVGEGEAQAIRVKAEAEAAATRAIADAEAYAIEAKAAATSKGLAIVAKGLEEVGGNQAAALRIAEQYVDAFGNIAKKGTTVLLPSNASDPASMVTQAMSIYQKMSKNDTA